MTEITAIGLGRMGSALARALAQAGHQVTVWNRTPARVQPLLTLGARSAATVAEAVQASPLILVCIDNYAATLRLLGDPEVRQQLSGRTLIQLSTGSPGEARESEAWCHASGALYVDGAILCGPESIGTEHGRVLLAGAPKAFQTCEGAVRSLGGDVRYLGEGIGAPAALDLAWLSALFGAFAGAAHGASICEAEGVGVDLYAPLFIEGDMARRFTDVVAARRFSDPGATLQVWAAALERIREQAAEAAINRDVPDFVAGILQRAIAAGHGEEHIAAMTKVFGRSRP